MLDHYRAALTARQESETRARRFVADASHELRTPLAAIRGYAELARRYSNDVPGRGRPRHGRVQSEADRMTSLAGDLLLWRGWTPGVHSNRSRSTLSALAVDAVSDAHVAGPEHDWRLRVGDEPVVDR